MTSSLPFLTSSTNTHAGFNLARLSNNPNDPSQSRSAKAPDKPLLPYMRYSKKTWSKVRAENPEAQMWDIGKIIGQMWRDLPEKEKSVYQGEYDHDKVEYEKQNKQYRASVAYQQTIVNRAAGSESQVSIRKVAASRFDRNQKLICDLFNEQCVQDTRTVTTQSRMTMLKRQSASLALHQSKLEAELGALDQKFQAKKRLIEESSEAFGVKLTKVIEDKPHLDKEKYEKMIETSTEKLTEAYKTYKTQMEEIEALQKEHKRLLDLTPDQRLAESGGNPDENGATVATPGGQENGDTVATPAGEESDASKDVEMKSAGNLEQKLEEKEETEGAVGQEKPKEDKNNATDSNEPNQPNTNDIAEPNVDNVTDIKVNGHVEGQNEYITSSESDD